MLRNTFVHAPGIGRATEHKLWDAGARCWDDFLSLHGRGTLAGPRMDALTELVEASRVALYARDSAFFWSRLSSHEQWRLYSDFAEETAFVDIETTGLSMSSEITVIGLYDGARYRAFVRGQDLDDFPLAAERYRLIVTYNGAQFDVPFLRSAFPSWRPQAHLDLRFPLARLGYRGGLKSIERQAGLARPSEVAEMSGYDAVLLWQRHERGERGALERLIEYTRQDVENLKPLAELAVREMRAGLGLGGALGEAA